MFVITYLLCAIILAIIVGRLVTVMREHIVNERKHYALKQARRQIAK